ncbi:RNA polymerase sigma factor [Psychroserpens ponticola]|uniref:RNA polymerase sigma factor n=1 Tax=Psychroserpens ponticola TaxID=2932268 RepID=A0ABY7S0X4_9FLAO|nr:RNA polymerase sigma factor [Psychroserpens ponticola]WCO03044.1 RNA polymerase sigma factor [Psychroserpens ponticola]
MTLTNQNIEQLLQLCKSGDQHAQMEVYNRYYKAMYNTAFRIVKDSFEAEDIMQDSFLTAFTKLDTLKEIKTFGSWLKRIVINNSIYHYKKNNKYEDVPLDDVLYKVEDHSGIVENNGFTSLKANQVLETMKTLKDNYRMGLTLHLIEGYDYEEICDIMDITYANCRTLISRAKDSLRNKLTPLAY